MRNPFKRKDDSNTSEETVNSGRFASFAKKVGDYFNTEPQKEKVLSHEDFNAAGDVYYASVSANYKIAQRLLVLFLVFFLVFSMVTNIREITYDNLYYLAKDFISAADVGKNSYETLSYESDSRQNFVLYRGGIATVSPSKISIFTATGRRTLNETSDFSSPFAVSSDKYVLFYDTAGNRISIYNSFSRIFTAELENSVKCASLADNGSFAVVTKSATASWSIRIYDEDFNIKGIIPCSGYVFGLDINSETEKLAVLSYELGAGVGLTRLSVYDLSKMKDSKGKEITNICDLEFSGEFPIGCGFTNKNTLAVITDSYVRTFNAVGEEKEKSEDYSNGNLSGFSISKNGVAVSVMRSSGSTVMGYDNGGSLIFTKKVAYNVLDVATYGNFMFLKTDSGIVRINTKNGSQQILNCDDGKMLIYNEGTALVCGESKAEYLVFN